MQSGYIRADYDRPELHWRTVNGDTDLFGDGLIRLVETRATPPASRTAGLATRPIAPPRGVESTLPQGIDLQSTDGAAGSEHKPPRHAAPPIAASPTNPELCRRRELQAREFCSGPTSSLSSSQVVAAPSAT